MSRAHDLAAKLLMELESGFTAADGGSDKPTDRLEHAPDPRRVIWAHRYLVSSLITGVDLKSAATLERALVVLEVEIARALKFYVLSYQAHQTRHRALHFEQCQDAAEKAGDILASFAAALPCVRSLVVEDIQATFEGDPAARTYAEVKLSYPGLLAVASHRIAHELYGLAVPILPRMASEWAHRMTGIDIHPGARIGPGLFIDHGTGVVIGETASIGARVRIYQGVTLGAKSFSLDEDGNPVKGVQRHPTVEDDVIIYANATILGGDTIIGKGSTVGGNVFLMESVPPGSFVVNNHPELKVKSERR